MIERSHVQLPPTLSAPAKNLRLDIRELVGRVIMRLAWFSYDLLLPLGIVAGFFWLQVRIDQNMTGIASTLVTLMSVVFEFGAIIVWSILRAQIHLISHR